MVVVNKKWSEDQFKDCLAKVCAQYPTGRDIDLDEAIEYHRKMPKSRNLVHLQSEADAKGATIICPRIGFATYDHTLDTIRHAINETGSEFVRVSSDTYTRRLEFDRAKAAIEQSVREGRSLLNGFPSVNHGLATNRRLYEAIGLPITTSNSGTHNELHFLMTICAGATEALGDAFQGYFVAVPSVKLEDVIANRQFVDRLVGYFEDRGISVFKNNKLVGVLPTPSVRISSTLMGMLLAAEQGVKNFSLQYTTNNCVIQDVAAQRMLRKLSRYYLNKSGYQGNVLVGVNHFSGAHPEDRSRAFAFVAMVAATARWGGASRIETKTVDEGRGIATWEGQVMSLKATKEMLYLLRNQKIPESDDLHAECDMIEKEVRAIVDRALELGDGDIAIGAVKSLKAGTLDYTYPGNKNIPGKAISVRDCTGAVRYLDCGNLPFSKEVKDFHRRKVAERKRKESKDDYQLIVEDLTGRPGTDVAGKLEE